MSDDSQPSPPRAASRSRGKWWASVALFLGSTMVALLLAEGVLRLALNPVDFLYATPESDPVLVHRIAPHQAGHDALGFRNPDVPAQVRVLALGDSHTYGVSAPREGSWPAQLASRLGEPVYNMGLGGYGPLQYLHLARTTAKGLKPKVLVVGVYMGNDLMDAYNLAHGLPYWQAWRRSALASAAAGATELSPAAVPEARGRRFGATRDWLARRSMLYGVLRGTLLNRLAASEREAVVRQSAPDERWPWSDPARPELRTVFTPHVRLSALDLDRPPVREGLQITVMALDQLRADAATYGADVLVMLIPTKESAYCPYLLQASPAATMPASLTSLCAAEARTKAELMRELTARQIASVDASPALQAKVAQHVQLYPLDSDGHSVAGGYAVEAQVAADALARLAPRR